MKALGSDHCGENQYQANRIRPLSAAATANAGATEAGRLTLIIDAYIGIFMERRPAARWPNPDCPPKQIAPRSTGVMLQIGHGFSEVDGRVEEIGLREVTSRQGFARGGGGYSIQDERIEKQAWRGQPSDQGCHRVEARSQSVRCMWTYQTPWIRAGTLCPNILSPSCPSPPSLPSLRRPHP